MRVDDDAEGAGTGRISGLAAGAAGTVAALLAGVGPRSIVAGIAGLALLAAGVHRASRASVTCGGVGLFAAALLAAGAGASPRTVLGAGAGTLLAWTFGQTAVDLRASLGDGPTADLERAHLAGTTGLVGAASVAIYLVYAVDWGTVSPLAAALLVLGGVALTAALRG